jgi:hypothetical protein
VAAWDPKSHFDLAIFKFIVLEKFMNHKLSVLIRHAVIGMSALFALSGQAAATTTDLGAQAVPSILSFGNTFFADSSGQQFYDNYLFSIPTASVDSISSTINFGNFWGINNLQSRLYSGSAITAGQPSGLLLATSYTYSGTVAGLSGMFAVIDPVALNAGNYTLQVLGNVAGAAGGSYAGVLNISAVPEAEEWILMLVGFGLIGFIVNRRKRNAEMESGINFSGSYSTMLAA